MEKDKKLVQINIRKLIHLVDKEKDIEKLRELTYNLIDYTIAIRINVFK